MRDNDGECDAAVWILEPWWLNEQVIGEAEVIPPGAKIGMVENDAKRYEAWLPKRFETVQLPELPVAIYPSHTVPRISTQRSCFTVHGSDVMGFEKLGTEADAQLMKVLIPADSVRNVKEQLALSGIDEVTIYPDLDGLGRFLTSVLKIESSKKT